MNRVLSPSLQAPAATRPKACPPICWLNVVCLDAPLVAIAWQALFAETFRVELEGAMRAALFLTAWLIYLADRFADSLSLGQPARLSLRQEFCVRHRIGWLGLLAIVAATDAWVVVKYLDAAVFRLGVVCGLAAIAYLAINALSQLWRIIPLKEITIGSLFAAGVTLVPAARGGDTKDHALLACSVFAVVCALNCMSIAAWERELDSEQGKASLGTWSPALVRSVPIVCVVVGVAIAGLTPLAPRLFGALAVSAFFLAVLGTRAKALSTDTRTALADLAMLTPLIAFRR
ncbi:MAG: hypothetical protein M3Z64_02290 [Verrucomicrobiota bacterium]|nr:hypothetical protein [Verrucomicrobiota bacterium]